MLLLLAAILFVLGLVAQRSLQRSSLGPEEERSTPAVAEGPSGGGAPPAPTHLGLGALHQPVGDLSRTRKPAELVEDEPTSRIRLRLVDYTGAPLADVRAKLRIGSRREALETRSDAEGRVSFALDSGRESQLMLGGGPWALRALGVSKLLPDEERDLERIALGPAGVKSGRVLDPNGIPLPQARVLVFSHTSLMGLSVLQREVPASRIVHEVRTDARGYFELHGLGEGSYGLLVRAPDLLEQRLNLMRVRQVEERPLEIRMERGLEAQGWLRDAGGAALPGGQVALLPYGAVDSHALGVEALRGRGVAAKDNGSFRLQVTEEPFHWIATAEGRVVRVLESSGGRLDAALSPGFRLSGRVATAAGAPVAEAKVVIVPADAVLPEGVLIETEAHTDSDGRFALERLPAGTYRVTASAPDSRPASSEVTLSDSAEHVELELAPDSAGDERPRGRLMVQLRGSDGVAIPRAKLSLTAVGAAEPHSVRETDDFGIAVWDDLLPGTYEVAFAGALGRAPADVVFIPEPSALESASRTPVRVDEGETTRVPLDLRHEPTVRIHVTRRGAPVPDVLVGLSTLDAGELMWVTTGAENLSHTDGSGQVLLPALRAGDYVLVARTSILSPPTSLEVTLGSGPQDVYLELASGSIRGSVVSAAGLPLRRVEVAVIPENVAGKELTLRGSPVPQSEQDPSEPPDPSESFRRTLGEVILTPSADGTFLVDEAPPGLYEVRISGPDHVPVEIAAVVGTGPLVLDPIVLAAVCSLSGTVLGMEALDDPQGSLVTVQLLDANEVQVDLQLVDSDGRYEFVDLIPGVYRLAVHHDGEAYLGDPFEVTAGGRNVRDLSPW
ncbi:MAG: carboxypeptidase-like regulatory domain-containing protein [Planctomycetota bacterium]